MFNDQTIPPSDRTLILHPVLPEDKRKLRTPEVCLEEACGLAEAIALEVVAAELITLKQTKPSSYFGTGKVEEIKAIIAGQDIALTIVDTALSPVQQRNLEMAWKCKVIDRTALILEIFGERANTKEGTLQVDLAALEYQKSRLVRSWTHLERQRGGGGFMGGPGEKQIESDRRMISERISNLKQRLEKVRRTRTLHRKSRKKVPYPIVALVGYTNAGKSTLFNRLTDAKVMAKDILFATLDPTMRLLSLPSGRKVILSDTVGFISELPTELVAAFRATLEEVVEADIILHVCDVSSPNMKAEKKDVLAVLENLGIEKALEDAVIEVWNKKDLIDTSIPSDILAISALTGEGCEALLETIDAQLDKEQQDFTVTLDASEGKRLAWIYGHGEKVETQEKKGKIEVKARMSAKNIARFKHVE